MNGSSTVIKIRETFSNSKVIYNLDLNVEAIFVISRNLSALEWFIVHGC